MTGTDMQEVKVKVIGDEISRLLNETKIKSSSLSSVHKEIVKTVPVWSDELLACAMDSTVESIASLVEKPSANKDSRVFGIIESRVYQTQSQGVCSRS
ncbi:hypothetical protein Bca4012_083098 [Brassica carinata]